MAKKELSLHQNFPAFDVDYLLIAAQRMIEEGGTVDFIGVEPSSIGVIKGTYLDKPVKVRIWIDAFLPNYLAGEPIFMRFEVWYDEKMIVKTRLRPEDKSAVKRMYERLETAKEEQPDPRGVLYHIFYGKKA